MKHDLPILMILTLCLLGAWAHVEHVAGANLTRGSMSPERISR